MVVVKANPVIRGTQIIRADRLVRLQHVETGEYLHMDGQSRTGTALHSWLGTRQQVKALRAAHAGTPVMDGFVIVLREGESE